MSPDGTWSISVLFLKLNVDGYKYILLPLTDVTATNRDCP